MSPKLITNNTEQCTTSPLPTRDHNNNDPTLRLIDKIIILQAEGTYQYKATKVPNKRGQSHQ